MSGRTSMLPGFLVIGAKRSGSTSLYEYIAAHPDVRPVLVPKGTHYFDVNYQRGWGWYQSNFPPGGSATSAGRRSGHAPITGEASPYYLFHPLALPRIAAALPQVKLIAVLREPVDRAYSHYRYECSRGFETLTAEEAFDREPERLVGEADRLVADPGCSSFAHRHHSYLARSRYAEQIRHLYCHAPAERVLLMQSEALFADSDHQIQRVYDFLGLRRVPLRNAPRFKANDYEPIDPRLRARLERSFRPLNEELYSMPGVDFRWS